MARGARRAHNGVMPDVPLPDARLLTAAQAAEMLAVDVDEVVALILEGRLRGTRVGTRAQWRVEASSIDDYLEAQTEEVRRMALWRESQAASFPELWGRGSAHAD